MKPVYLLLWLPVAAWGFAATMPTVHAQSAAAGGGKPARPASASTIAHVRFWKTDLRRFPFLRVVMTPATGTPRQRAVPRELGSGGVGYQFSDYMDVPSGRGTLEVFEAPAAVGKRPTQAHGFVSLPVDLVPGSFVTVLLDEPRKEGASPQLDAIVDGMEGEAAGETAAQVNVRNFVPGLHDVRVTFGDSLNAQFAGGNSYLQMRGLKPAVLQVHTMGTGADGKPFEWITEADLRQHHRQTLLIYPDPYGRVRPRMSVDGETQVAPPDGGDGQR